MEATTAAAAATALVARLVAKGMTPETAIAYVVDRMIAERPALAVKVFTGLAA